LIFAFELRTGSINTRDLTGIPVSFPVYREFALETGSYMTAHTTTQSYQTADFRTGTKQAVSAGAFAGFVPLFRSLATLAVYDLAAGVKLYAILAN
jgi:hypothetical protein